MSLIPSLDYWSLFLQRILVQKSLIKEVATWHYSPYWCSFEILFFKNWIQNSNVVHSDKEGGKNEEEGRGGRRKEKRLLTWLLCILPDGHLLTPQSHCSHLVCLLIHAEHFLGYPAFQPVRTAHFSTDPTWATGNEEKTDTTGNAGIGWARCSGGDKPAAWKLSVFIIYSWPRRQAS